MELAADLLSPELVLVSPPEAAERARALLGPVQLWEPAVRPAAAASSDRIPFVTFCGVCLTTTLAPLALIAALH
jgi:hypothetical protein